MVGAVRQDVGPSGRAETIDALVSACERLCSTTPPALVSVRDIALEAGVTTGLVHHYFESKDALLVATLRSMSAEIDGVAREALHASADPGEMVRAVWRVLQERPAFAYIVAWWLLEGRDVTDAMGDHPFLRRLSVALGTAQSEDGQTDAGVVASMILAGTVFRLGFNRALGRKTSDAAIAEQFERTLVDVTRDAAARSGDRGAPCVMPLR